MAHPAFGKLENESARDVVEVLRNARARLLDDLVSGSGFAGANPTEFDRALVMRKRHAIEEAMRNLGADLGAEVTARVGEAARLATIDLERATGFPVRIDPGVIAYAQATAGDKVVEWTAKFSAKLRGLTTQAFAGGLPFREYVSEIRDAMGKHGAEHAVDRIVRTELNRGYQQQRAASDETLAADGVDLVKVWVSQLDLRVRDSHLHVHGQERELADPFNIGQGASDATPPGGRGYACNGPLDPSLPAEEAINCRCDVLYVPRSKAKQPYIVKATGTRKLAAALERDPDFAAYLAERGLAWPFVRAA